MRLSCCAAALLLACSPPLAHAQAAPDPHAGHAPAPAMRSVAPTSPVVSGLGEYPSAFSTYRGFNPEEPLVDWRAANEEVRNSGGHVGLMRATTKRRGNRAAPGPAPKSEAPKGHH